MTEYEAIKLLFKRYKIKIKESNGQVDSMINLLPSLKNKEKCSEVHLLKLLDEAIDNTESYPTDKLQRWLGFIQGVLSVTGVIDVDEERDYTRPILHSYHKSKPKSF